MGLGDIIHVEVRFHNYTGPGISFINVSVYRSKIRPNKSTFENMDFTFDH